MGVNVIDTSSRLFIGWHRSWSGKVTIWYLCLQSTR